MEHVSLATSMVPLAWIPLLPLLSFAVLIFFGRWLGRLSAWLAVAALASACALTVSIAEPILHGGRLAVRIPWLSATDPLWSVGFAVDGLSWLMLIVVTSIGTLIALYSIGYMHDDPRFSRFFAYLSLFCASMLALVMADHFVLLYAGWELVGLCSYLLISFWFEKPAAAAAGRKAFLTTRVGDTGLFLGICLLTWTAHELHFDRLEAIRQHFMGGGQMGVLTVISTLVFLGAVGKSAQIPLHVWLPDAMEGPTPVSALIHAATMVAAGVYLIARTFPLFTPESLTFVLAIGLSTHLLAGTVALTMTDIKRVLAYSTLSQLGLMMTALGIGAMPAAIFHLFTHAIFKALLFLGAGSVIHATHHQELSELGGLRRYMPWTSMLFLIASLSMGGLLFFSGFWSKDAILIAARASHPWLFWLLLAGAAMTASYIFRLYLRCFYGPQPDEARAHAHPAPRYSRSKAARAAAYGAHGQRGGHVPHESPIMMVAPMAVLGLGAICAGLLGSPFLGHSFFHLFGVTEAHERIDVPVLVLSTAALAVGVTLAWLVGFKRQNLLPEPLRPLGRTLYTWAANKYYVDEFYSRAIIQPFLAATEWLARFDRRVIDGAVDGAGNLGWSLGQWKAWFDRTVVDGIVNGVAVTTRGFGRLLRWIQTGVIQQYLLVVVAAVVVLSLALR